MTGSFPSEHHPVQPPPQQEDPGSLGEIIGDISDNLTQLFRKEVELAKAELKQEASKAGQAAGMMAAAGVAGLLFLIMFSHALVRALDNFMGNGWATLIVALLWAIIGAVLFSVGRKRMSTVSPVPRQTVETLKEDAQWLKNPTG